MSWQEVVVAIVVGLAIVSLYRHLGGLLGSAQPGAPASCRGCDDCADDVTTVAPTPPLLHPPSTRVH